MVDVEVLSVLRGRVLASKLSVSRAESAMHDLTSMRFPRTPHLPLAARIWELRANVSAYDTAYVALAELLDCLVLTADEELTRSSGPRCSFEVIDGTD